jgi:hypothetical protein
VRDADHSMERRHHIQPVGGVRESVCIPESATHPGAAARESALQRRSIRVVTHGVKRAQARVF